MPPGISLIQEATLCNSNGDMTNEEGRTPLHMAILNNDEVMTRILLEQGADPNEMDCY